MKKWWLVFDSNILRPWSGGYAISKIVRNGLNWLKDQILRFLSNNCTKLTIFWGVRCLTISFWTSWILLISLVFVRSCLSTMQEKCVNISLYFFVIVFTRTEIHWCNTLTLRKIDVFLKVPNFCLISVECGLARNCSYSELRKQNMIKKKKKNLKQNNTMNYYVNVFVLRAFLYCVC